MNKATGIHKETKMAEEAKTEETAESKDYADFSDMGNTEIPDEIDDTPAESEQAIQYFEETPEETPAKPAEETPIETSPEPVPEEPKTDSYWQSQHDLLRNQAEQDKPSMMQEIESLKTQLPQAPKEEPLVEPVRPKEAFLDNPQDWANYYEAQRAYDAQSHRQEMDEMKSTVQTFKDVLDKQEKTELANAQNAYISGKLQTVGKLTPEESMKALAMFSEASTNEDAYIKKLADFYRNTKGQSITPIPTKPTKTPSPLATQTGETQTPKVDESDQFTDDMNDYINKNY